MASALIIYALIHGFSQDGCSYFYGSLKYIMENTNLSKETVLSVLQSLVQKGLIVKKSVKSYALFDRQKSAQDFVSDGGFLAFLMSDFRLALSELRAQRLHSDDVIRAFRELRQGLMAAVSDYFNLADFEDSGRCARSLGKKILLEEC